MGGSGSVKTAAQAGDRILLRLCRVGLLVLAAAIILATVDDYGVSWDEPAQVAYGDLIISYFRSHGADLRVNEFANQRFYGPGIEPLSAWLAQGHPADVYRIRHLVSAATMLLTVPALYVIGEQLAQAGTGLIAGFVLLLMPMFWGHGFVNSKDIPLAMAFAWVMAALLRLGRSGRGFVLLGGTLGLALACRPGMLPLLGVFISLALVLAWRAEPSRYAGAQLGIVAAKLLAAVALGWALMVALWPWAHESIVWHPLLAMREAMSFIDSYPVLFAGSIYDSRTLPASYLVWHFLIGMPLVDVVLLLFGNVVLIRELRRRPQTILVLAWVALPILLWTVTRANIYDGMRHFLFVLPGAALIVAAGANELYRLLHRRVSRFLAAALVTLLLLTPLSATLQLHPYEMTYFNGLSGGIAVASQRYETDYWLTSYKEAMEWINAEADAGGRSVRVLVAANALALPCASFFKSPRVEIQTLFDRTTEESLPPQFDYYLATTRYGLDRNFPATPIAHSVGRLGAVFSVVKANRGGR